MGAIEERYNCRSGRDKGFHARVSGNLSDNCVEPVKKAHEYLESRVKILNIQKLKRHLP
jgi:hypothetical protein